MRGNIEEFADMQNIMALINGPITPGVETDDADYIAQARALLPMRRFDTEAGRTGRTPERRNRPKRASFVHALAHGPDRSVARAGNATFAVSYRL
ncbi:MAG: hypothetical protein CM15mP21_1720 [Hyphomicrobiales bacterium]|nr:MAG: hypothetical protein CM15mP21_1720 [Hyphomicrobiales bacterium]